MSKKLLLISLMIIFAEVCQAGHRGPDGKVLKKVPFYLYPVDCYTCANLNNGNNFMCDWGGFPNPVKNKVVCCENSESEFC